MSDIIDDLRKVAMEKAEARDKIARDRVEMEKRLREEVNAKVWAMYGEAENKASVESTQAHNALRLEMERRAVAVAAEKIPYPVGTRMVLWQAGTYAPEIFRASSTRGIMEIFKAGDEFPLNQRWNRPAVGSVVVRILTKDGKPGKNVEKYGAKNGLSKWAPEGQDGY